MIIRRYFRLLFAVITILAIFGGVDAILCADPLSIAFIQAAGKGDLHTVESSLLTKGIDVNVTLSSGQTALMAASLNGHKEVVELLLVKGADVNAKINNGLTALMVASQNGHKEVVELLLAKGADVNAKVSNGSTAMTAASKNGHQEVTELLRQHGGHE